MSRIACDWSFKFPLLKVGYLEMSTLPLMRLLLSPSMELGPPINLVLREIMIFKGIGLPYKS